MSTSECVRLCESFSYRWWLQTHKLIGWVCKTVTAKCDTVWWSPQLSKSIIINNFIVIEQDRFPNVNHNAECCAILLIVIASCWNAQFIYLYWAYAGIGISRWLSRKHSFYFIKQMIYNLRHTVIMLRYNHEQSTNMCSFFWRILMMFARKSRAWDINIRHQTKKPNSHFTNFGLFVFDLICAEHFSSFLYASRIDNKRTNISDDSQNCRFWSRALCHELRWIIHQDETRLSHTVAYLTCVVSQFHR